MNKYVSLFVVFLFVGSSCTKEIASPGDPRYVSSIAITNKINDISVEQQYQFEAAYYPWDAVGFNKFTWQSSDNAIATIDQYGLLQAVREGDVTIKLTAKVKTKKGTAEKTDMATIHVGPIKIESIQLNRAYLEMLNYSTDTLTVSFVPSNAKSKEIDWTSSNETVATVDSGVIMAKSIGYTLITAQVRGTDIKATCNVQVTPVVVTSMQFETKDVIVESGLSFATKLIFYPDNAENKKVIYTSSNRLIAEVDTNGVIIGHYYRSDGLLGKGPVSATVTATSLESGVNAMCSVAIYSVPDLVSVSVVTKDIVPDNIRSFKGYVKPTLHNNSSKPVRIVRFRILDRFNNYDISIPIGTVLEGYSSYTFSEFIRFEGTDTPRAVFDFEFESVEYRTTVFITR